MTLPTMQAEHATVADDSIRAMLEAFAGPADPISDQEAVSQKRTASRRTLVVLAAAVVTLGLSVPAALALLGQFSQKYPDLYAWSYELHGGTVGLSSVRFGGPIVSRVAPGTYRIDIMAAGDMPLHVQGPGLDRFSTYKASPDDTWINGHTYTVYERWVVRLRAGRYVYRATGPKAARDASAGVKIVRRFVVHPR